MKSPFFERAHTQFSPPNFPYLIIRTQKGGARYVSGEYSILNKWIDFTVRADTSGAVNPQLVYQILNMSLCFECQFLVFLVSSHSQHIVAETSYHTEDGYKVSDN